MSSFSAAARIRTKLATLRNRLWPLRIGWHIALMLVLAVGLAIGLGWAFSAPPPNLANASNQSIEGTKLVLTMVAGVGGVVALTVAYRRQKLNETTERRLETAEAHAQRLSENNEAREQAKHFHERFDITTNQLGSDRANVRSAGAYALAHLADDWDAGRQTCINVLCNYIRMPYTPPKELDGSASLEAIERNELRQQQRQVRQTILELIGQRLRVEPEPGRTWHGHDFDFTGADNGGCNFSGAKFTSGNVNFVRAEFIEGDTTFSDSEFSGGSANFSGAKLVSGNINFRGSKFTGGNVDFSAAEFAAGSIDFYEAEFAGGSLIFEEAGFGGGNLRFDRANFNGGDAYFSGAQFTNGTLLFGAKFVRGNVWFGSAEFIGGTIDFRGAEFIGSSVRFGMSEFIGGNVDFTDVTDWSIPPTFPTFSEGQPDRLLLPATDRRRNHITDMAIGNS